MYRAIFANKANRGKRYHHLTVMLRFMWGWLDKFKPCAVNVFWDAKRGDTWRRRVFDGYKLRDEDDFRFDIKEDLIYTEAAARAILKYMGVRQFKKSHMEADDLIYSACRVLSPYPMIICSTDADYTQILFRMQNVKLFSPQKEKFVDAPDHNPAVAKALAGDKTDKIDGYYNIGPVKSAKLARSISDRNEFLAQNGRRKFIRNLLLIDLSLCPDLLKNDLYVEKVLSDGVVFDKQKLMSEAKRHKVSGFATEFTRIAVPFKLLLELFCG